LDGLLYTADNVQETKGYCKYYFNDSNRTAIQTNSAAVKHLSTTHVPHFELLPGC